MRLFRLIRNNSIFQRFRSLLINFLTSLKLAFIITRIEQLPVEWFTAVVQLLEFLSEPPHAAASNPEEVALVEVIQRHLPPNKQKRLEHYAILSVYISLPIARKLSKSQYRS
jgi:hypothetical protein